MDDDGCIAGDAGGGGVRPPTYQEAEAACAAHGLQLCEKNCYNTGCGYDGHPVWTKLECDGA